VFALVHPHLASASSLEQDPTHLWWQLSFSEVFEDSPTKLPQLRGTATICGRGFLLPLCNKDKEGLGLFS